MSETQRETMTAARVRAIQSPDLPRVWEMLRGLAEYERLAEYLTGTPALLEEALFGGGDRLRGLVAEREGRLVGYALYYPVFGSFRTRWRLWLEDLYVEPDERGAGTGMALMAELAREVERGGYYSLDWEVLDWNRSALDFYEQLGGEPLAKNWLRYRLVGPALEKMAKRPKSEGSPEDRG
jgi:GNAT superfamily N-acetyltransferase